MSHHEGVRYCTWLPCKSSKCFSYWDIYLAQDANSYTGNLFQNMFKTFHLISVISAFIYQVKTVSILQLFCFFKDMYSGRYYLKAFFTMHMFPLSFISDAGFCKCLTQLKVQLFNYKIHKLMIIGFQLHFCRKYIEVIQWLQRYRVSHFNFRNIWHGFVGAVPWACRWAWLLRYISHLEKWLPRSF